jgi:hypothetical protein
MRNADKVLDNLKGETTYIYMWEDMRKVTVKGMKCEGD